MKDLFRINLLYDFYCELLTEKQKEFMTLYYFDDLSLSEVAAIYRITPQGVRDLLKRTEKLLYHYESKLKLLEKHELKKQKTDELCDFINEITGLNDTNKQKLAEMVQALPD